MAANKNDTEGIFALINYWFFFVDVGQRFNSFIWPSRLSSVRLVFLRRFLFLHVTSSQLISIAHIQFLICVRFKNNYSNSEKKNGSLIAGTNIIKVQIPKYSVEIFKGFHSFQWKKKIEFFFIETKCYKFPSLTKQGHPFLG